MKKDIQLHWEWPDDRTPTQTLQVHVDGIKKTSKGLFGYRKSPSYVFNYPDSMDLTGTVVGGDQYTNGKSLLLTLPLEAVNSVNAGDIVKLGIVDSACISVTK